MTATALQLPVHAGRTGKVGRRLYRKQILPIGKIDYKGRRIDFSRDYLSGLVRNFNDGAYDQVPFMLADAANAHTMDPERMRGEVRRLELADDGLYALLDLSDDGAKVIEANPRLGVSARIVEGLQRADGKTFKAALNHVLGTLDPRVVGMKPWEPVDLAAGDETTVVDLTAATFTEGEPAMADEKTTTLTLTEAQAAKLRAFLDGDTPDGGQPATGTPPAAPAPDISDEELDALLGDLDDDEPTGATDPAEIAAAVALGEQNSIELASVQAELAAERWKNAKAEYLAAGVPPAMLAVAGVELAVARGQSIELSNGTKSDPAEVIRGLLDAAKGIVDLSSATGSPQGDADAGDKALLDAWSEQYPTF